MFITCVHLLEHPVSNGSDIHLWSVKEIVLRISYCTGSFLPEGSSHYHATCGTRVARAITNLFYESSS